MSTRDTFLREHASVHTRAVGGSPHGADDLLAGLDEDAWRARPHGLNSLAWLLWHVAAVEDTHVAPVVFGESPLLDRDRAARLRVDPARPYASRPEVEELSRAIDIGELLAYRDEVGRRTRTHASAMAEDMWNGSVDQADLTRGAEAGHLTGKETWLVGTPREALLFWWAVSHSTYHLGQAAMVRRALGRPAD